MNYEYVNLLYTYIYFILFYINYRNKIIKLLIIHNSCNYLSIKQHSYNLAIKSFFHLHLLSPVRPDQPNYGQADFVGVLLSG